MRGRIRLQQRLSNNDLRKRMDGLHIRSDPYSFNNYCLRVVLTTQDDKDRFDEYKYGILKPVLQDLKNGLIRPYQTPLYCGIYLPSNDGGITGMIDLTEIACEYYNVLQELKQTIKIVN